MGAMAPGTSLFWFLFYAGKGTLSMAVCPARTVSKQNGLGKMPIDIGTLPRYSMRSRETLMSQGKTLWESVSLFLLSERVK